MKFNVRQELEHFGIESTPCDDGIKIRISYDSRTEAERLPDDWAGPCVQVVQTNPMVLFVHGKRPTTGEGGGS